MSTMSAGASPVSDQAIHCCPSHYAEAFKLMEVMQRRQELCDVTLNVGDTVIHAHKVVLAATIPYFHAMFTNEMVEKKSGDIHIHDVDAQALRLLVEYSYSSEVTVTEENVQVLLPAACLLQVTAVRDACCRFLMKQLHPSNCLGIRRFADTHSCTELLKLSQQFIMQNFVEVCETEEFVLLPPADLKALISSEELNISCEEQVYQSVAKWIKHDLPQRECYIAELLSCVRLPLLSRDFLMNTVATEVILQNNSQCKDLLIEAMRYHLMPEKRFTLQSQRTCVRKSVNLKPVLFAVGGGSLFAIHSECECFDPATEQWTTIASMYTRRSRSGIAEAYGKIYAVGGYDGSTDLCTAECYNTKTNRWARIPSMGTKRSCLGVCGWNGLIFAVGGYDGASCLNSVERFDPLTSTWTSVAAMSLRRRYLKAVVLDNCVYAVGGYDGSAHLSSLEKYDPQTNKWTSLPSMISRRSNPGVAVLDGMIYACGGSDGTNCLSSVERYNPRRNLWEAVASMHSRRSTHDVVSVEGALYAVGGNDGSTSLHSMERYNPKSNRWQMLPPMSFRRSSVATTCIPLDKSKVFVQDSKHRRDSR